MDYNILATTEKITMSAASSQLWMNLRAIGDPEPKVSRSRIKGIVMAQTTLDPIEAIIKLREHMESEVERYDRLFRVFPIVARVPTEIETIVEEVQRQAGVIEEGQKFRITLEKRETDIRSLEIIEPVAAVIARDVDLKNPDWVILIEVMGKMTGVSVMPPEGMLNVQKERYALSTKAK
ncbi:THUMP domain-containing protein [Candidatus Bathyarchaeota archaeon]|nr:THUMP domain-containing protein [Candidatus Bathyarchaeota archaeon]